MAKKSQARRVPRAAEPRMFGDGKPSQTAQKTGAPGSAPVASVTTTQRPAATRRDAARAVPVTLTQDYRYVLKDLRHLGILAAGVFAVLIALGLIIR